MKENLENQNEELEKSKGKMKSDLDTQTQDLNKLLKDFSDKFEQRVKKDINKDLTDAKERKNARSVKNNELEEQWNIRKIEMRKQRDKFINESEEKKELQIQHTKLDEAYKDQAQEISNYKHRISELVMGIEEKRESLTTLDEETHKLKNQVNVNEDSITKLETELAELKQNDKLDSAMEQMPLEKLKTYYEN